MTLAGNPTGSQAEQESDLLGDVDRVQMAIIGSDISHDVLPWDNDQDIQIEPPSQQKREIESSHTRSVFILWTVRAQGQGGHQGNDVQEQDHVPGKQVGNISLQKHFEVGPQQLIGEPEKNAKSDERPEKPHAPFGSQHQRDEGSSARNQQNTLDQVADRGEAKRSGQENSRHKKGRQQSGHSRQPQMGTLTQDTPQAHILDPNAEGHWLL